MGVLHLLHALLVRQREDVPVALLRCHHHVLNARRCRHRFPRRNVERVLCCSLQWLPER